MRLEGYAALFGSLSGDLGDFRERIEAGAFSRSLRSREPVYALHHHQWSEVLGSTKSGTLTLHEDQRGLWFELTLPDSPLGQNVHTSVRRGDVTSMSFSFRVKGPAGERWEDTRTGIVRTLLDVDLFEVSTVARPAYPATSVAARTHPSTSKVVPLSHGQAARNRMTRRLMAARLHAA